MSTTAATSFNEAVRKIVDMANGSPLEIGLAGGKSLIGKAESTGQASEYLWMPDAGPCAVQLSQMTFIRVHRT